MRIIGGEMRGRRIVAPKGQATRPTTDRVRESLFGAIGSRLGTDLEDIRVLDVFGGSGALGFESLSRGAHHVTFVEKDRAALDALRTNTAALGVSSRVSIHSGDASVLARRGVLRGPYSLILLDPPYRLDTSVVTTLLEDLLRAGALDLGALVTWEHASGDTVSWPTGLTLATRKRYGTTEIEFGVHEEGDLGL